MPAVFSRRTFLLGASGAALSAGCSRPGVSTAPPQSIPALYQPTWESLDAHPCPEWYRDAKLGMYFHWGASSVPGWAPRAGGTPYAEWYWHSMQDP
ncbi:MAG: alpha-L-fucosidase, partial [Candidatus Latescibacterota bacterium]